MSLGVDGEPRSSPGVEGEHGRRGLLEGAVSPGAEVYSFTFG